MFQAQQSLKQDEQEKRLAQIIAKQGIVEAERELAPTDELFQLTSEQRAGLQFATRKAIDATDDNATTTSSSHWPWQGSWR